MPLRTKPKRLRPGRTEAQNLAGVLDALAIFGVDAERQNTGAAVNPSGRMVMFGRPGNSDVTGILPASFGAAAGKRIDIEVKAERWDPRRLRGSKRSHWERQRERLMRTCEAGGYGFVVDDPAGVVHALDRIKEGWRIEWDGDFPWLVKGED